MLQKTQAPQFVISDDVAIPPTSKGMHDSLREKLEKWASFRNVSVKITPQGSSPMCLVEFTPTNTGHFFMQQKITEICEEVPRLVRDAGYLMRKKPDGKKFMQIKFTFSKMARV